MRLLATLLLLLLAAPVLAQTSGSCALGTASADLDYNDVHARLYNKGNLFFDGGNSTYEVPRGSGVSPLFASTVWIGGLVEGDLRTAAATYAQVAEDYELYPGPLGEDGSPPEDCTPFDRIWVVNVDDIDTYETSGVATDDLAEWPVFLGAPVVDGDGVEGNYDLEGGDRPRIYGSETAFWVMNDAAGEHLTTMSKPIGMEVRVTAFSAASENPAFDQATFYRHELVYRGEAPLEDAYFSFWTDPHLGNFQDDLIGTDTTRSLLFAYNRDNDDELAAGGYGENPPAVGIDFLQGVASSMHFISNFGPTAIPDSTEDFYHYMQGQWLDGSPLTEGDLGYHQPGPPTRFLFPGDPVIPAFWSGQCPDPECSEPPASPGDQKAMILSTEPFTMQPGDTKTVDLAIVFAQGADHIDSITELRAASDTVQAAYDAGLLFDNPNPVAAEDGVGQRTGFSLGAIYPNPLQSSATVSFTVSESDRVRLSVYDVLGREVAVLEEGPVAAGVHRAVLDGTRLTSGVYFVVLAAEGQRAATKVLLLR